MKSKFHNFDCGVLKKMFLCEQNEIYWHTFVEEKEESKEERLNRATSLPSYNNESSHITTRSVLPGEAKMDSRNRSGSAGASTEQVEFRIEVVDTYENEEKVNGIWVSPSFHRYHWSNVDGTVER